MNSSIASVMTILIVLSFVFRANGSETENRLSLLESVERIREGVPPTTELSKVSESARVSSEALSQVKASLRSEQNLTVKNCARYVRISGQLIDSLYKDLVAFSIAPSRIQGVSDADFELINHLQILIA